MLVLFEGALTAEAALDGLAERGYAVRHLPGQGLPQALRITIGTARADGRRRRRAARAGGGRAMSFERVAIIGLGLIGGSIGLAVREHLPGVATRRLRQPIPRCARRAARARAGRRRSATPPPRRSPMPTW